MANASYSPRSAAVRRGRAAFRQAAIASRAALTTKSLVPPDPTMASIFVSQIGWKSPSTGSSQSPSEKFPAKTVWSYQTGSGIVGQPVTWEMDGKQYVTVLNGSGAVYTLFSGDERLADVPPGGAVWTFALAGN